MICPSCNLDLRRIPALPYRCRCGAVAASPSEWTRPSILSFSTRKDGPGTELSLILKSLGILEKVGCTCAAIAAAMNALGPSGCIAYRETILAELRKNSILYSAWEKAVAGLTAVRLGLPLTLEGLFDLAISRAEALTDPSPRL